MASKAKTHYSYTLTVGTTRQVAGMKATRLVVHDRYSKLLRHRIERRMVRSFTNFLQWYLLHRPSMEFESPGNVSRLLTYLPSGMRAWRSYMPGGVATYHAYKPTQKRMPNGKTLDIITRSFFRHTYDAVGLRSRAHMMAWAIEPVVADAKGKVQWVSIAGGSGQPVFDAIADYPPDVQASVSLTITDIDPTMLAFAQRVAADQNIHVAHLNFVQVDVVKQRELSQVLKNNPTIVDAMGLFEYLTPSQCVRLLHTIYHHLPAGGVLLFSNMSPRHPHLHVHQRALGWPGVIQRTIQEVAACMQKASIPKEAQSVYYDQDGVYNVYKVVKQ